MLTFKIKLNKHTFNNNMAVAEKSLFLRRTNHYTNKNKTKHK